MLKYGKENVYLHFVLYIKFVFKTRLKFLL